MDHYLNRLMLAGLLGMLFATSANAEAPTVPTAAPYIVLSDNHDEPNGYGFCLDTVGRGKGDRLHSHSCKPTQADRPRDFPNNDTRFSYDQETGRIESYPFEGFCMQLLVASPRTDFALLECSDHPHQKFIYSNEDRTIRMNEDPERCVSVADSTVPAGPWVKRLLALEDCDDVAPSLREWTIQGE